MPMIYVKLYTYHLSGTCYTYIMMSCSSGFSMPLRCLSWIFVCILHKLPSCYTASSVLIIWYTVGKSRVHVCVQVSDTSYWSLVSAWLLLHSNYFWLLLSQNLICCSPPFLLLFEIFRAQSTRVHSLLSLNQQTRTLRLQRNERDEAIIEFMVKK